MGIYTVIFARSFQLALVATLVCLLIGYPLAYVMAKEGPGFQRVAMVIIMLPMWVNFLLRTYAWMAILENNGILNNFLRPSACSVLSTASSAPTSPSSP